VTASFVDPPGDKPRRGVIRPLDCSASLHLMGEIFRLKHMAVHGAELLEGIEQAIRATRAAAPIRSKVPYSLRREVAGTPANQEAQWERAIWSEWRPGKAKTQFLQGVCSSILTYQMMLRNTNDDVKWGEVDLVGISPSGLPVAIEIKRPGSTEPPIRGVVEAVAYAIAIQEAWKSDFADQWRAELERLGLTPPPPSSPSPERLVFAAPAEYWERCTGRRGKAYRVPLDAWTVLFALCSALQEQGLDISLARLDATDPASPGGITARLISEDEILGAYEG
jgi:hypothetical protein